MPPRPTEYQQRSRANVSALAAHVPAARSSVQLVSPPQAVVDWSQIISAAFSLIALVAALFAIHKSTKDLAKQQRLTHELEVLRALGQLMVRRGLGDADAYLHNLGNADAYFQKVILPLRDHLLLLPGSDDLPLTRVVVNARPSHEAKLAFAKQYGLEKTFLDLKYMEAVQNDGTSRRELEEAIDRRLTVSMSWWRRLLGGRCL